MKAEEQKAKLLEALKHLMTHSHCNILLTSRRVGYQGSSFALSNTTFKHVVELMVFDQKQVTGFIERWFATDKERKTRLQEAIRQEPTLYTFARLPLQLALLCQIASTYENIPTQRTKLFETILNRLLSPLGKQEQARDQIASSQAGTWTFLEYIAWHFATFHGHWCDLFPALECYQVAQETSQNTSLALSISSHVLQRVSSEQDGHLRFLHCAFQEYLVARHLAHQPLEQWRKQVLAHCRSGSHWMRVIVLLAGCLQDPNPLLELLLNEPDDVFHTMLFLAGRCLAEANRGTVKQDLTERIVSELLIVLSSISEQDRRQAALVLGRLDVSLVARLLTVLRNKDEHCLVRSLAVEVVQGIRHSEAEEDVIVTLQEMDNCKELRTMAAWALRRSGSSQAMKALLTVLQDQNDYWEVRTAAAEALGVLSDPQTVHALFSTLQDQNDTVYLITLHPAVVEALNQIGEPAIQGLLKALKSKNRHVRIDAIKTLGVLGASQVVSELLIKLQDKNEHREVRIWLVWALGQLGDLRASGHLLAILQDKDEDLDVRSAAIWALEQLGDPQAVEALITFRALK
jgi:HEAT repeat protein